MRPIPPQDRQKVIIALQNGNSINETVKKTGVKRSVVGRINQEMQPNKENIHMGRPASLSPQDKRRIIQQIETGKLDNAVQAADFINKLNNTSVHPQTIRNLFKKEEMRAVVKRKAPLLKKKHREDRLAFALKYQHWTIDDWKLVLWSDETKINRIGSDGRVWVWKKKGEPLSDRTTSPTVKHGGGSVMVWGCMGWNGPGMLTEVEGRMDSKQYVSILEGGLMESVEKLDMDEGNFYFQQDNDPKHTSKKAYAFFVQHDINCLDWPSQSPDLNPIEHLWEHIKRQLHSYPTPPSSLHQIWERLAEEWNKIPPETCQNLIMSMPRRLQAVIKQKGGHTKY